MAQKTSWSQIRDNEEYHGVWVALDHCRYDSSTHEPIDGELVDADADLAELCGRMEQAERTSCAILFCGRETPTGQRRDSSPHERRVASR